MKTYNEILVERLRKTPGNTRCAPLEAADVIEEQDRKIEELKEKYVVMHLQAALINTRLTDATARVAALENTMHWIYDNPGCYSENIRGQIKRDLGL